MRGRRRVEVAAARTAGLGRGGGGGVPARTGSHRPGQRTQKSASVGAPTSTDRKELRKEWFVRQVSGS